MSWQYSYDHATGDFKKESSEPSEPLKSGEVAIEPISIGICGSDVNRIIHKVENPSLGHEWVGKVLESQSENYQAGDIITSVAHVSCGKCKNCQKGDYSECSHRLLLGGEGVPNLFSDRVVLRGEDLIKLGEKEGLKNLAKLSLLEVAFIGDCAYHQAKRVGLKEEDSVVVFGAGAVGLFSALAFRERGHEVTVIEAQSSRIEYAKSVGLKAVPFSQALIGGEYYRSFDTVVDCTGDSYGPGAIQVLPKFSKVLGKVVIVGKYQKAQIQEKDYADNSIALTWVSNHQYEAYVESIKFWMPRMNSIPDSWQSFFSIDQINESFTEALTRKHLKCCLLFKEQ